MKETMIKKQKKERLKQFLNNNYSIDHNGRNTKYLKKVSHTQKLK